MSSSNESYINKKIQRVVKCPMREIKYFSMVKQYLFLILTPIQFVAIQIFQLPIPLSLLTYFLLFIYKMYLYIAFTC